VKSAVDSCVIISIARGEPAGKAWLERLKKQRKYSRLIACEVVFSETRPCFLHREQHQEAMTKLGIHFDSVHVETAALAGEIFQTYRKSGGTRERILPDFLIGAHAVDQADQILSDDHGFFRKYFSGLKVVGHAESNA